MRIKVLSLSVLALILVGCGASVDIDRSNLDNEEYFDKVVKDLYPYMNLNLTKDRFLDIDYSNVEDDPVDIPAYFDDEKDFFLARLEDKNLIISPEKVEEKIKDKDVFVVLMEAGNNLYRYAIMDMYEMAYRSYHDKKKAFIVLFSGKGIYEKSGLVFINEGKVAKIDMPTNFDLEDKDVILSLLKAIDLEKAKNLVLVVWDHGFANNVLDGSFTMRKMKRGILYNEGNMEFMSLKSLASFINEFADRYENLKVIYFDACLTNAYDLNRRLDEDKLKNVKILETYSTTPGVGLDYTSIYVEPELTLNETAKYNIYSGVSDVYYVLIEPKVYKKDLEKALDNTFYGIEFALDYYFVKDLKDYCSGVKNYYSDILSSIAVYYGLAENNLKENICSMYNYVEDRIGRDIPSFFYEKALNYISKDKIREIGEKYKDYLNNFLSDSYLEDFPMAYASLYDFSLLNQTKHSDGVRVYTLEAERVRFRGNVITDIVEANTFLSDYKYTLEESENKGKILANVFRLRSILDLIFLNEDDVKKYPNLIINNIEKLVE